MRRTRNEVADSEDDLYSGYNEFPSALNTDDLEFDETFQNSARNVAERRPVLITSRGRTALGSRLGTSAGFIREEMGTGGTGRSGPMTRGGTGTARPITGIGGEFSGLNRPMTAVRGAGYTTSKNQNTFDPFNQNVKIPSLELKADDSPESKIKQIEEKISVLIEESVLANCKGNFQKSLEHAKDAQQKEKSLMKLREQASLLEGHDWDISFSVLFNLANQYEACEMFTEALSTYQSITKNKFLVHGAKVKINMGNIYLKQNLPTRAIKMYRMAMDQLANSNRTLRLKLMHNMGVVFLQINHSEDAVASFEYIMMEKPTFKTGLHLVVANFMTGEVEKTKRSFQELLQVPIDIDDDEKYTTISDDPVSQLLVEVLKNDKLRKLEKERKTYAERCVLSAARLIAPFIENSFTEGYHWVTEAIKSSRHAPLAHALEISKALVFLKQRELGEAIEILKSFEKKETKVATAATTNLSFLFYLQGDLDQAEKYGEAAKVADFYNSSALVNLGNCMAARGDPERAKQLYLEAISMDSSCVEALYNIGLMSQKLGFYEEALDYFHKMLVLVRNHGHVLYQIGRTHELMGEIEVGVEWYLKALALLPTDVGILIKLAQIYERDGDRRHAYQYYYDSYKCNPGNVDVIEWIAAYMLSDINVPERAIVFYKHANEIRPSDPKWLISIAACYRKMGNNVVAIEVYQKIFKQFPDNLQALQQLVRHSQEIGSRDTKLYAEELKKLEKLLMKRSARNTAPEETNSAKQASKAQVRDSGMSSSGFGGSRGIGKDGRNFRNLSSESVRSGNFGSNTTLPGSGTKSFGRELHGSGNNPASNSEKFLSNHEGVGTPKGKKSFGMSKLATSRDSSSIVRTGTSLTSSRSTSRSNRGSSKNSAGVRGGDSDDEVDDFFSTQLVPPNMLKF